MSEQADQAEQSGKVPGGRGAELQAATGFGITVVAALALAVVYRSGGQPQLEGVLLALALGGMAYGFVIWGTKLLPQGPEVEERHHFGEDEALQEDVEEDVERGGVIGRRRLLLRMVAAAAGAVGIALVFPIRSLGPAPGKDLLRTSWKKGSRAVTEDGKPVRAEEVPVGALLTVFPEGHAGSSDAQTVLVRVDEGAINPRPGRETWSPEGLLAYSKVCTHAGCPVGLFQVTTNQLFCPCHQSAFDVLEGARPVFGPATRSLPQLPIEVDEEGHIRAQSDYTEPVGPAFWNLG